MKSVITIVGRQNVGKSTLFNRLVGFKKAITEDTPGVTRDRNYGEFHHNRRDFILIDTGGFEPPHKDELSPLVLKQIATSVEESSLILFLLDGKEGLLPEDMEISANLRRYGIPVLYVINKLDSEKREQSVPEFFALGVERFYPVSAAHGLGMDDMLDAIDDLTRSEMGGVESEEVGEGAEAAEQFLRLAIVGRPNTGKSSLVNRLLGEERMIVSEIPGTTRDAIDTRISFEGRDIILIDTAGLRRKSRVLLKVEGYSVASALRSVDRADVVNLVVDAEQGASHQDAAIAHTVLTRGKGMCIVVNKWDLVKGTSDQKVYTETVRERIPHASFCPVIFTSALTGRNVSRIIETDMKIHKELYRRIPTPKLNKGFEEFFQHYSIPQVKGRQIKIFYGHQAKTPPPTFILFSNAPELIPDHYKKYLENSIRGKFGLGECR
jgi:GTPase